MLIMLLEMIGNNLLFGFLPEKMGLFVFGILLVLSAVGMRWFFDQKKAKDLINKQ